MEDVLFIKPADAYLMDVMCSLPMFPMFTLHRIFLDSSNEAPTPNGVPQ